MFLSSGRVCAWGSDGAFSQGIKSTGIPGGAIFFAMSGTHLGRRTALLRPCRALSPAALELRYRCKHPDALRSETAQQLDEPKRVLGPELCVSLKLQPSLQCNTPFMCQVALKFLACHRPVPGRDGGEYVVYHEKRGDVVLPPAQRH
jgi:hypothetical protein